MRIDRLMLRNFRCFQSRTFSFHPEFNLIVGMNGTGRTSVLEALSVAVGSWFLGVRGFDSRHVWPEDVRLGRHEREEVDDEGQRHVEVRWTRSHPCEVAAQGVVQEQEMTWIRSLNTPGGRTTYGSATNVKQLAAEVERAVRSGEDVSLPLISYYGTGRLWQKPRQSLAASEAVQAVGKEDQDLSRLAGYRNSVDPRLSAIQLARWMARQSSAASGMASPAFSAAKEAMIACMEEGRNLEFDPTLGEVVVELASGTQPFSNLSDGQRCMLAMIGDIAHKAATLNPHLGSRVLLEATGVVLIDELDLHLHPRWQQRVIEDLRRSFPKIQFICTTHSPFLIQSLRSGEGLVMLDGQPVEELWSLSIEEIAQVVQRTERFEAGPAMQEDDAGCLEKQEDAEGVPQEGTDVCERPLADAVALHADD